MTNIVKKCAAILIGLALTATGLWAGGGADAEPAAAAEKEMVMDPTTGEMVSAPEYGGTITGLFNPDHESENADIWHFRTAIHQTKIVLERMGGGNWGLPRDEFAFAGAIPNVPQYTGRLAESWEQPDATTIVLHIRRGVKWHDKEPMNGRELVADDVVFNFSRNLGLGEFAADGPSPQISVLGTLPIESITATDKYTVVFELEQPRLSALYHIIGDIYGNQYPPEVIRQDGDAKDWTKLVGTGPFMWTDWVQGTSLTYTKNPDYWGNDEKYPDNRLPYVDELKALIMPEEETRIAALRSRQLDVLGGPSFGDLSPGPATEGLERTNPELRHFPWAFRDWNAAALNITEPPFDDVRVRRAMQMALDLETVADTYFNGYADATPRGVVGLGNVGYAFPFTEWSDEIKGYNSYDVEGAERLLDEAGYPRGADGVRLKTVFTGVDCCTNVGYTEIIIQFWDAIGVDVEFEMMTVAEGFFPMAQTADYEGIAWYFSSWNQPLPVSVVAWQSPTGSYNPTGNNAPDYEVIIAAIGSAKTVEEERQLIREADRYLIENHLYLWGPLMPQVAVTQPWIVGYNGESNLGDIDTYAIFARLWIDHAMKESMGN